MGHESTLSADRPIANKSEDRLGRGPFVARLSSAIASWTGQESLVIGLCGEWGSGKSSVKNLVLENLTETGKEAPETLEFNPWQWRGHDEVSAAFFGEVLRKLKKSDKTEETRKLTKIFQRYARFLSIGGILFDGIRIAVGAVFGVLGLLALGLPEILGTEAAVKFGQVLGLTIVGLSAVLIWGEKFLDRIAAWIESYSETGSQSLGEQKRTVAGALQQYSKSMLVVIDDIDRLTGAEIRAVFQLIKANADFPRFIYLVLFQRSIVERALQEEGAGEGSHFLEKIVQVAFDLPLARREDIEGILFEGLDLSLGKDAEDLDETYWGNVYSSLRQYFRNLRDVKRYLGTFNFHLGLLRSENVLEVHPVDLIALEALSTFEPQLYRDLPRKKALLTGRTRSASGNKAEFHKECQEILDVVPKDHREAVKDLMKELFPPIADAFGGMQHGSDFYESWLKELRVCSPEVFDRFFRHTLSPHDVSQAEVGRLIALTPDSRALTRELKQLSGDGRLMTALDRFALELEEIDHNHIADALIAMFNIGADLPDRALGFFGMPPHWSILRITTKLLLREKDENAREQILERAIREADSCGMPIMVVGSESKLEVRKKHPENTAIPEASLTRLQGVCVEKIRKSVAEGEFVNERQLAHLLYRWRDWTSEQEVKKWVVELVASEHGATQFLRAFLHEGTSQGLGDKVAKVHWYIKLSETESFADSEQIEKSLADVSLSAQSERDRRAIEQFRRAIAKKRSGSVEDNFGGEDD